MERIGEKEGRTLFGRDPLAYDVSRPPYPPAAFTLMQDLEVVFAGASTLEIGAGSGAATRPLLALGVSPLVAVEPDPRFQEQLAALNDGPEPRLTLLQGAFEDVVLADDAFDLVVAATAFHWLDPATRVARIARALKAGGSVVLLWNLFQDSSRQDHFHLATRELLGELAVSPSGAPEALPFALDKPAREREFVSGGPFESTAYQEIRWTVQLTTERLRALYGGFSSIARLPAAQRAGVLDKLAEIADRDFAGRVTRNMTSVVYVFRRI